MRHYDTRPSLDSPPFTQPQLQALSDMMSRRDERLEQRMNRVVCGLSKRTKKLVVPIQIRSLLLELMEDCSNNFEGTEFGENMTKLLSGRIETLNASILEAKEEAAKKELYTRA